MCFCLEPLVKSALGRITPFFYTHRKPPVLEYLGLKILGASGEGSKGRKPPFTAPP
ncbi:protein of unknown function [Magnetospirillum sp. XM-1]|nr:protein of unknown function [Magnetospirillum sp. XM-1]